MSKPIKEAFEELYGEAPHWVARAPGRVNLIGEHTDYNDGFVLPMAIERDTVIAAAPNVSNTITLRSAARDGVDRIEIDRPIEPGPTGRWSNYPRGVIAGFIEAGHTLPGFDALIQSTVPIGGGLSSSAALEVAMATLLEAIIGEPLDPMAKALLCQKAEHAYAGVPCGIMDQFISTMAREGHLLLLDCRSRETELIALTDPSVAVLIIDTKVKHQLASSQYPLRRQQCEQAAQLLRVRSLREATRAQLDGARHVMDPAVFRRARHVISEIDRTVQAADGIRNGDWHSVGQLMYSSHQSLQYDFEVSCRELDAVVGIAESIGQTRGVFGCRMTGGGFGGCAVALIQAEAESSIARTIVDEYRKVTGFEPAVLVSRAAHGATVVQSHRLEAR